LSQTTFTLSESQLLKQLIKETGRLLRDKIDAHRHILNRKQTSEDE
jgi:hypothetical protein